MKLMKRLLVAVALGSLVVAAIPAVDAPGTQADAKITEKRTNPGGKETQGKGKAITTTNVNPSGKAPAGQNK